MDAMDGEVYTALFLAEPVSAETQAEIRSGYENLYSSLSPFRKSTWSYSENQSTAVMESLCSGTSHTISDTVSTTTTDGTNQSSSVTDGTQKTKGVSGGINGGVGSSSGTSVTKISLSACMAIATEVATSSMLRLKASPVGEKPNGDSSTSAPMSSVRLMPPTSTLRTRPLCWKSMPSTMPTGRAVMKLPDSTRTVLPAIGVRREEVGELFEREFGTEHGNSDPTYLTHEARRQLRPKFLGADIAMTGVNFAVASTGTLAVCTNEGNADMGTSFPDLHIAIMGLEKVIPDMRALAVFTRLLARSGTGQPVTSYTSLYRKPAPGKRIHVVIVDNGRSEWLADAAHRNMLKCLRCGACMNTCPVYRRSGGYSYSYFIPGPLGINLGMLRSPERYGGNVSGCSLCYSCSDVCPAKIDLGEQIYAWRQEMGEKNLIDWHKKFMVKGMDFAMGGPGRFYAAVGAARIAEYLPRFVLNNKLNPWYAYGRDIPHFARSTFNARWKAGKVKSEKPTER